MACLASEALGCIVKFIYPVDKKQYASAVSRGKGRERLTFGDNCWSKTYVPTGLHMALGVREMGGKEDTFVEEATATSTKHVVQRPVFAQSELEALKITEVGENTDVLNVVATSS